MPPPTQTQLPRLNSRSSLEGSYLAPAGPWLWSYKNSHSSLYSYEIFRPLRSLQSPYLGLIMGLNKKTPLFTSH